MEHTESWHGVPRSIIIQIVLFSIAVIFPTGKEKAGETQTSCDKLDIGNVDDGENEKEDLETDSVGLADSYKNN